MFDIDSQRRPLLIAHRGYRAQYPENTLAAFQAASDHRAPMIELDVALTRDRQLIVIHDDTVDRTTDGHGAVMNLNVTEIRRLDAGSWFHSRFRSERIPLLSEVLELAAGKTLVNIEIKKSYYEDSPKADAIEQQVVQLIERLNLQDQVLISSFEIRYLQRLHRQNAGLALAFISNEPADTQTLALLKEIDAYSWHPWYGSLTREQVDQMHAQNHQVFCFTVNSRQDFLSLKAMGVDGVFTDDGPALQNSQT